MPVKEKKTSRAEFAYDTLKRRILDNQLPPGAMLSEVALAQKLNMSRTPIREALKMLMRDDLVEIRDGVGTFVKSATQKDIEDAYAVRQALEVLAARTAIGAFSPEELDALEARFRSLQYGWNRGRLSAWRSLPTRTGPSTTRSCKRAATAMPRRPPTTCGPCCAGISTCRSACSPGWRRALRSTWPSWTASAAGIWRG